MKQEIIQRIQSVIENQPADAQEILSELKEILNAATSPTPIGKESKEISDLVSTFLPLLKEGTHPRALVKTGFTDFDNEFGGFALGEFIIVGARPSMGKTQLLINLSLHISKTIPVLYFTFDLPEFLLTSRFISTISGVGISSILQHNLTEEESRKLDSVQQQLSRHKIFLNESCNNSMAILRAICQQQIQNNGVKVVIVDYLQMINLNASRNSRELEVSRISNELKSIAQEFNVCVIASSQLSRSSEYRKEGRHPQLSDLRESGSIEQNADKVLFIYRPEYYDIRADHDGNNLAGFTQIIVAKNRTGSLGNIKLLRDAEFTTFRDFDEYYNKIRFCNNRLDEIDIPF